MLTLLYNFTNSIDEMMTQKELMKSPEGNDFISRWTWKNQCSCDGQPRFRKTNTIEDYFYVRIIEEDALQAIGAIRIHWNTNNNLILDTSIQIVQIAKNYHWCEDPAKRYDLEYIIKKKLYGYLNKKMMENRFGCDDQCDCNHTNPNCNHCPPPCPLPCPPHPPVPPCPPCDKPYYRGYDDRGLFYKSHSYVCKPGENEPNPPKNGPYGGTYNAYDDIPCK